MNRTRLRVVAVVGVLQLVAAGCSGSGSVDEATAASATTSPPSTASTTSAVPTTSAVTATSTPPITCTAAEPGSATASDWGSFGFDDANSRYNRAETQIGSDNVPCLEILWSIDDLGGVSGTPVVVDGVVYFGDWNGALHAVEAESGAVVWEEQITTERVSREVLTETSITATALVTDTRVFVPDMDAILHARDRATGSEIWTVEVDDQSYAAIFSTPLLIDNMIIVAVGGNNSFYEFLQGSVVALDADTGIELWRLSMTDENSDLRTGVWTSAAVDRDLGLIFLGTGDSADRPARLANALVAIDYQTGELVWHNVLATEDQLEADVGATPNLFTIDGRDVVGVGGKNGLFLVADRQTGTEVWSAQLTEGADSFGGSTAALGDGVIYVSFESTDSAGSITFALDMSDGSTIWERPLPAPAFGSMTLANGVLFHGTVAGTIYALDASDGAVLWSDELPGNFGDGISIANGKLFVGYGFGAYFGPARDGGIVAYSVP